MNKNTLKTSLRMMIVLGALVLIAQGAAAANVDADGAYDDWGKYMGAGIALGLAAVGAGISQAAIGSAAVGMIAEDGSSLVLHSSSRLFLSRLLFSVHCHSSSEDWLRNRLVLFD